VDGPSGAGKGELGVARGVTTVLKGKPQASFRGPAVAEAGLQLVQAVAEELLGVSMRTLPCEPDGSHLSVSALQSCL
jgi:hypothetical protein